LTELLLYTADRAQHVSEVILPALEKGDWVISDRFSGSTLSYQGYGRNLNIDLINQLEQIATQGIVPDITFWFDLSVQESLSRRKERANDRIEAEGVDFLMRVSNAFSFLAQERNWVKISAALDQNLVSQEIQKSLENYLLLKDKRDA